MAHEIRSERDLFEAIRLLEAGALDDVPIRFVDWPTFEITIQGEGFDGGVPTRIMPAFIALQRAIDRAYARSVHGRERALTPAQRRRVELIVRLEPGSTTFLSEMAPALNNALVAAARTMSGTESLIAILGVAAIAGGVYYLKQRLNHLARMREIDHRTRMDEEETERLRIVTRLAEENAHVAAHLADAAAAQDELLRRLDETDRLLVRGEPIVGGDVGRRLIRKPRPERVQDRLDADFMILSVESGQVRSGFRVRVRDIGTGDELMVSIPEGTLPAEQIADLQSGEWGKAPLHMRINIVRAGSRIVEATLVSAGLSRP